MNAHCPQCGYPIHRKRHASIGVVRFCRSACMVGWMGTHGLTIAHTDNLPDGVDRRRSS